MQFSFIQPIDRALSGATIPGQSGPGSNGNKVLVVWVLWYINIYRIFNAKSILKQIISSISNNSV